MSRIRKVVVILGAPGMGKTALTRRIVEAYRAQHGPDSVRILDPAGEFDDGEFPGRAGCNDWIDELTAHGKGPGGGGWGPGLLVLDDADRYLLPTSFDSFRDVWLANRHLGLDVVVSAHRTQAIPKDLVGSASELWLFGQDEPNALDYLMRVPSVRLAVEAGGVELPSSPGLALRVLPRARSAQLVKVF